MRATRFTLLIFCLLLAACGTTGHRVTVESGPVGLRPWQRPYSVDGERYVPLLNADGYREEGLASWYGAEEHGGPTSNGETFDMYRPTAAHKTLPLGCFIKVTNKVNGKTTVARVNDRGPFVPGRIVDLSFRGAQDLEIVDRGVTPVALEVVGAALPAQSRPAPPVTATTYTLQVAAFSDREKARLVSERMEKEMACSTVRRFETERGIVYRVLAGKFRSRSDAEAARASLARNGFPDTFIVAE
jgi:rare lipoprotein A